MLEKAAGLFADVKQRWRSPLFSSFIISWCIVNWRVPIGMLFYNSNNLNQIGYSSYVKLIMANNQFWIPCGLACSYTLLMPGIKSGISILEEWINKITNRRKYKINSETTIAFKEYYRLSTSYKQKEIYLKELISEQDEQRQLLNNTRQSLKRSHEEEGKTRESLVLWSRGKEIFNGYWTIIGSEVFDSQDEIECHNGEFLGHLDGNKHIIADIVNIAVTGNDTCLMKIMFQNGYSKDRGAIAYYDLKATGKSLKVWVGHESLTNKPVKFRALSDVEREL